jgi:hypothetical protein
MLDTENGRGALYVDSPTIKAAFPQGYEYARIDPPFAPQNYIAGIEAAEKAGITVLIIDSASHEWEGIGGCEEIAEKNAVKGQPNWKMAKMAHKRFMNRALCSPMHVVFCLRARDKVKFIKTGGKTDVVPIGIQPICEKGFMFELLISMRIEEETHHATPVKVPEPLVSLFPKDVLISKELGQRIREWNDTGAVEDPMEQLKKRARSASADGIEAYREFFGGLKTSEKKQLRDTIHEECKLDAEQATAAEEPLREDL